MILLQAIPSKNERKESAASFFDTLKKRKGVVFQMLTHYRDYESFKQIAVPLLEQRSDIHQLPLGILERGDVPILMAIAREGDRTIVVLQTIEEQAILAGDAFTYNGIRKLSRILNCPGYIGEQTIIEPLLASHSPFQIKMDQGIYTLRNVIPPAALEYRFGLIEPSFTEGAVRFGWAFIEETGALPATERSRLKNEQTIRKHIEAGTLFGLFDGGQLLAMASSSRPTASGVTISYVFTPQKWRKQGIASYLVACLSDHLLTNYPMVSLYTDWSNPTSNKIYQAIGFELVGRSVQITKRPKYQ